MFLNGLRGIAIGWHNCWHIGVFVVLENLCVFPEAFTQRFSCAPVRDKLQWLIACVMPSSYFSELLFRKEKKKRK
jgi:hypothetical protein